MAVTQETSGWSLSRRGLPGLLMAIIVALAALTAGVVVDRYVVDGDDAVAAPVPEIPIDEAAGELRIGERHAAAGAAVDRSYLGASEVLVGSEQAIGDPDAGQLASADRLAGLAAWYATAAVPQPEPPSPAPAGEDRPFGPQ